MVNLCASTIDDTGTAIGGRRAARQGTLALCGDLAAVFDVNRPVPGLTQNVANNAIGFRQPLALDQQLLRAAGVLQLRPFRSRYVAVEYPQRWPH